MIPTQVPNFGIGEIDAPLQYVADELPILSDRLGLSGESRDRFIRSGMESAEACIPLMDECNLCAGMVNPVPQARAFWNLVGDELVSEDSTVTGLDHLQAAMEFLQEGGNVVIVQNHRSGADMLLMETLIRRHYREDVCSDWAYMAGHAVNLFLIPLMFSGAMRRFQIFSVKYQTNGIPGMEISRMKEQNQRALLALKNFTAPGGKVLVYYPEGGRGDGAMKDGEPRTTCLPRSIAENGKGLIILPTYVGGTERLLTPARGQNEFNEILANINRGQATLAIGKPICWETLCEMNTAYADDRKNWNRRICDTLLGMVAKLGPSEQAGPYSETNARIAELIAPLIRKGTL